MIKEYTVKFTISGDHCKLNVLHGGTVVADAWLDKDDGEHGFEELFSRADEVIAALEERAKSGVSKSPTDDTAEIPESVVVVLKKATQD